MKYIKKFEANWDFYSETDDPNIKKVYINLSGSGSRYGNHNARRNINLKNYPEYPEIKYFFEWLDLNEFRLDIGEENWQYEVKIYAAWIMGLDRGNTQFKSRSNDLIETIQQYIEAIKGKELQNDSVFANILPKKQKSLIIPNDFELVMTAHKYNL